MTILALESSATAASVALVRDGELIASAYQRSGLTHSATLLPMMNDMLQRCGQKLADVDLFAVSEGPGSFTGLRIGVATVKGLAYGLDKPCVGVSTLAAMAENLPYENGIICACMDARVGQVYNALFSVKDGVMERIGADRAIKIADLESELVQLDVPVYLVGDGAKLVHAKLTNIKTILVPENIRYQNAYGVALLAQKAYENGVSGDASSLVPKYLRLPQAERERLEKMKEKV